MKALGKGSVSSVVETVLTVARWVLWVLAGCLALGALGYAGVYAAIGAGWLDESILNAGGGPSGEIHGGGDDGFVVHYEGVGWATWPIVIPAMLVGAVAIGGAIVIVGRLRRLFQSFTSGEPFRRANADHLRAIWIAMLTIELARFALLGVVAAVFAAVGLPEGAKADFDFNLNISTWMSIAILIVLAEVFREGARMREEQELTI